MATLFELYGGFGAYNYKDNSAAFIKNLKHRDLFLQPSVALVDKNVELAFTLRYDHLSRRDVLLDTAYGSLAEPAYAFLSREQYDFIEPGITFRLGSKQVMGQVQISGNFALDKSYESIYGGFKKSGQLRYAFGLLINLHDFFGSHKN